MKVARAALAGVVAAALATRAEAQASETVTVSIRIPVTVPLQVPAGTSFREAAEQFVERNQLPAVNVDAIETALATRWQEMQEENVMRTQCATWQMEHGVFPLKDWGTLPADKRVEWLKYDCDSRVSPTPPSALVSITVEVDGKPLVLRAFQGDTVRSSVERFCRTYGVDFEQNGQVLVDAMLQQLTAKQQEEQIKQAEAQAKDDATFLFSIPINVDGKLVRLRVHEGDMLDELVSTFCATYGVNEAESGDLIRKAIVDTTAQLRAELDQQEKTKRAEEQASEPQLLLDIPISVDGADFSMKLYDGDFVDQKIAQFCADHGLDEGQHGKVLLQHIADRTQALNGQ